MKKQDYIQDMQDVFGKQENPKKLLDIAKKLKSLQTQSHPDEEYKHALSVQLAAIYELDASQDNENRFSIYQIFGILCSFIFIF